MEQHGAEDAHTIAICGGGLIGLSCALALTRILDQQHQRARTAKTYRVVIFESDSEATFIHKSDPGNLNLDRDPSGPPTFESARGSSRQAGGFLSRHAGDGTRAEALFQSSFDLFLELCGETHAPIPGKSEVGFWENVAVYECDRTAAAGAHGDQRSAVEVLLEAQELPTVSDDKYRKRTAMVDPGRLLADVTRRLRAMSTSHVTVVIHYSTLVVDVRRSGEDAFALTVREADSAAQRQGSDSGSDQTVVNVDSLVVAAGAWTALLFQALRDSGVVTEAVADCFSRSQKRAKWLTFATTSNSGLFFNKPPSAAFFEDEDELLEQDFYTRRPDVVYTSGLAAFTCVDWDVGPKSPLFPEEGEQMQGEKEGSEAGLEERAAEKSYRRLLSGETDDSALGLQTLAYGWGYLPFFGYDGLPIIGSVPGARGLYVAAGHGVWGVTTSLGSGEALAARVAADVAGCEDVVAGASAKILENLSMSRFLSS